MYNSREDGLNDEVLQTAFMISPRPKNGTSSNEECHAICKACFMSGGIAPRSIRVTQHARAIGMTYSDTQLRSTSRWTSNAI
jgi:hypothetical protein